MRKILIGAVLVAAALLSGCTSTPEPEPSTPPSVDLTGKWQDSDTSVFLELNEDETFLAFDGCNTLQGSWWMDGSRVILRFDGGTERGCEDIPDVWLSLAETADHDDDVLTFSDADGDQIGTLSATGKE
ncbi:hypothetical protein ACW5CM_02935 [Microbacterium sp. A588]